MTPLTKMQNLYQTIHSLEGVGETVRYRATRLLFALRKNLPKQISATSTAGILFSWGKVRVSDTTTPNGTNTFDNLEMEIYHNHYKIYSTHHWPEPYKGCSGNVLGNRDAETIKRLRKIVADVEA